MNYKKKKKKKKKTQKTEKRTKEKLQFNVWEEWWDFLMEMSNFEN